MRKRIVVAMLALFFMAIYGSTAKSAFAISQNIVISQIQTRSLTSTSASDELVELYNNSDSDIDITDWCLNYGESGTTTATKTLSCFSAIDGTSNRVMATARSYVLLVSKGFADSHSGFKYDAIFSSGLSDSDRWISLVNHGTVVDKVEWSGNGVASTTAEGLKTAPSPTSTQLIQRKILESGYLKDTDNNFDDFERALQRAQYFTGSVYELDDVCINIAGFQSSAPPNYTVDSSGNCLPLPIDVCKNLDGLQVSLPSGYEFDNDGFCQIDICKNIVGLQITMPVGKDLDTNNNCVDHDECLNIPNIQLVVPDNFVSDKAGGCLLTLLNLKITEFLPNANGEDSGHEFIEIYNPNDVTADLSYYYFQVGTDDTQSYTFPEGTSLEPMQYKAFYNDTIDFTLANTTGAVRLYKFDNSLIDSSATYSQAGADMSWGIINGDWQYSNQPTPGSANQVSLVEDDETTSELAPCAPNQYRNPETNRCKSIASATSVLIPCKDGQYRSEETNRCRSIASDANSLTPCGVNEERNPETNRCRSILGATSTLTPCAEGQERNPETNRCRNITTSVPEVGFAVKPMSKESNDLTTWWAFGGVALLALGYAGWEWRVEAGRLIGKVGTFFHSAK